MDFLSKIIRVFLILFLLIAMTINANAINEQTIDSNIENDCECQ